MLLLLVSMIGYALILSTGDPMAAYSASPSISAEDVLRLRRDYGLDRPVYVQYGYWLRNLAAGNWGRSYVAQQPVIEMLAQRLPNTLILVTAAYTLTLLVGIPLGVISAVRQYSPLDYVATGLAFIGLSMPVFWLGLMLMGIFAVQFKLAGLPYLADGRHVRPDDGPVRPGPPAPPRASVGDAGRRPDLPGTSATRGPACWRSSTRTTCGPRVPRGSEKPCSSGDMDSRTPRSPSCR